ncbi:hypothetical protein HNQ71_007117 [Mesorhizobium sangaii]|uniref:Uncharacterized protein n=1 Tax=Mesorhizobium sangaii TaxID=505389 RepID=A0A841PGU8_9HYPH|nr:hypothetical protein [Mesorhizobium sangaii]
MATSEAKLNATQEIDTGPQQAHEMDRVNS